MLSYWDAKIVVAIVPLPVGFAKALLESGAKAVVCRQQHPGVSRSSSIASLADFREDKAAVLGFFEAFYKVLLGGFPIVKALASAGQFLHNISPLSTSNECLCFTRISRLGQSHPSA